MLAAQRIVVKPWSLISENGSSQGHKVHHLIYCNPLSGAGGGLSWDPCLSNGLLAITSKYRNKYISTKWRMASPEWTAQFLKRPLAPVDASHAWNSDFLNILPNFSRLHWASRNTVLVTFLGITSTVCNAKHRLFHLQMLGVPARWKKLQIVSVVYTTDTRIRWWSVILVHFSIFLISY